MHPVENHREKELRILRREGEARRFYRFADLRRREQPVLSCIRLDPPLETKEKPRRDVQAAPGRIFQNDGPGRDPAELVYQLSPVRQVRQNSEAYGRVETPIRKRKTHEIACYEVATGVSAPWQNPLRTGFWAPVDYDIHAGLQQRRSELRMPTTHVENSRVGIQAERFESQGRLSLEEPSSNRPREPARIVRGGGRDVRRLSTRSKTPRRLGHASAGRSLRQVRRTVLSHDQPAQHLIRL